MNNLSLSQSKERLKEIIANPANNPIIFDTSLFSGGHYEKNLLQLLKTTIFHKIPIHLLKEFKLFYSFLHDAVAENPRIITLPGNIKETLDLLAYLKTTYESREARANEGKIYLGEKRIDGEEKLAHIRRAISKLEGVVTILTARNKEYADWGDSSLYQTINQNVNRAAEFSRITKKIEEISPVDACLIKTAFYLALHGKTPALLTSDRDIEEIMRMSLSNDFFPQAVKSKLAERVKLYRFLQLVDFSH